MSAQPDRRYRYVDDTADTVSIGPSEPRQQTMPEPDPRNLIIAQQARRIQELEIEISELKRARRDTTENVIGGCPYVICQVRLVPGCVVSCRGLGACAGVVSVRGGVVVVVWVPPGW